MNPLHTAAVLAVDLLPTNAPDWQVATVAMLAIIAALAAITVPPCLLVGWLAHRREVRDGYRRGTTVD